MFCIVRSFLCTTRSPSAVGLSRALICTASRDIPPSLSDFVVRKPGVNANLVDGKRLAKKIHGEVASQIHEMVSRGKRPPNLTVVLVGNDPPSQTYVRSKHRAATEVGMNGNIICKPDTISENELLELVHELNRDDQVDGLLVQLPLPDHISEGLVCQSVDPHKDVDGFHMFNIGRYVMGQPAFIPATPLGVLEILKRCQVQTFGKTACVVGRSRNIGFTLSTLLPSDGSGTGDIRRGADATTIVCHRYTPPDILKSMTLISDIIITATGVPGLIKGDMVKEGTVVIDVGITRIKGEDGKPRLVGDVQFDEVSKHASLITPVPGGVGPMTVAMVLRNTLDAAMGVYRDIDVKLNGRDERIDKENGESGVVG